jgi:hypothetical protein
MDCIEQIEPKTTIGVSSVRLRSFGDKAFVRTDQTFPFESTHSCVERTCEPGSCQYSVWLRAVRPGDRRSIPGRGERIFPLAAVSIPALRLTQPPAQWVLRGLFPGG